MDDNHLPKHAQVFESLRQEIRRGRWRPGERLPGEAALTERFGVSRITVSRAMRDLKMAGLIERRPGSGTYISDTATRAQYSFGLLIPDLGETEIFEPICRGMMASPLADRHALLWGNSCSGGDRASNEERAWHLCRQFIDRKVSGVFFAPLEHVPGKDELNLRLGRALDEARIPVVLLDRPLAPFPEAGRHDLVGIDNRRAGFVVTAYLLDRGGRRVYFIGAPHAAATVDERAAGYREALYARGMPHERYFEHRLEPDDDKGVGELMEAHRPDGIVCANDRIAGGLMHALRRLGYGVPGDVRIVGMDDVEYARLLPVPLTTLRQPTAAIGATAFATMLDRIARPDSPVRDIRLPCELTVRESCGSPAVQ